MPRRRKSRIYWRNGRAYADLRDFADLPEVGDSGREPLVAPGEKYATKDADVAAELLARRLKKLEAARALEKTRREEAERNRVLLGIEREETLGDFATHHLREKARSGRSTERWLASVEKHLERAIAFLGTDRPLQSVTVRDVERYVQHLKGVKNGRGGSLSGSSQRKHLNSLSNLFRRAEGEGCVPPGYNPVRALLDKPQEGRKEARWLEAHDAALFLEAARTHKTPPSAGPAIPFIHALVATFLLTGGRKSEVLGLAVDDVSFDRGTVTFRPNEHRRLKTSTSHRVVPLFPQLREILQEHVFGGPGPPSGLLFPSPRGGKRIKDIRKLLDAIADRVGWAEGEIRTRIFRHTFCAAALQLTDRGAAISRYTVAKWMGHGGTRLVERVYGHLGEIRHRSEVVEFRVEHHREKLGDGLKALQSAAPDRDSLEAGGQP